MDSAESFRELLRRVRDGDQAAAAELVELYEPEVRRAVRMRLTEPSLRRKVDSVDISQSVLGKFFVRYVAGHYDITESHQLLRLLIVMVRNKVADHARKADRVQPAANGFLDRAEGRGPSPSVSVAHEELFEAIQGQLTEEERRIGQMRSAGCAWAEIAAEVGSTPDAMRKKLGKAFDRICCRFDLDGVSHARTA
jgi:DNA-directed RNA polymerase specialized sigma24 family protein